jgi:hypothetical protein
MSKIDEIYRTINSRLMSEMPPSQCMDIMNLIADLKYYIAEECLDRCFSEYKPPQGGMFCNQQLEIGFWQ